MIDGWMRWVKRGNEHVEKCMMHKSTERKCDQVMKNDLVWNEEHNKLSWLQIFDAYDDFMNLIT